MRVKEVGWAAAPSSSSSSSSSSSVSTPSDLALRQRLLLPLLHFLLADLVLPLLKGKDRREEGRKGGREGGREGCSEE
jgi:hypothetical protein